MLSLVKKKDDHVEAASSDASPPAPPAPIAVEMVTTHMTTEPTRARGEESPLTHRTLATPGCWD